MIRSILIVLLLSLGLILGVTPGAWAAESIDNYVKEYLKATEPVPVKLSEHNETRLVSPEDLAVGKQLFKTNCINCHVGGTTLPNPVVSLSLERLKGATPPRDNLENFVAYMREPMTYDGEEPNFLCREVPESWMSRSELETLGAFILRAAEVAPGWGAESFESEF